MRVRSFAKINLGLEILGRRRDGFHEIRTLLQSISLHDTIAFSPFARDKILVEGDDPSIAWNSSNLVFQAARLLKDEHGVKEGMKIRVWKRIPAGRGLGGGSSNAAMTLWALNHVWNLGLEQEELIALGSRLGADVPFFFHGGLCLGEGKGERIRPLEDIERRLCVVALPEFPLRTASVYSRAALSLTSRAEGSKINRFLRTRDLGRLENDLEKVVTPAYPQIKEIKSLLQEQKPELSSMSGSGSGVFALFLEKEAASKALRKLSAHHSVLLAETLSREEYWNGVRAGV